MDHIRCDCVEWNCLSSLLSLLKMLNMRRKIRRSTTIVLQRQKDLLLVEKEKRIKCGYAFDNCILEKIKKKIETIEQFVLVFLQLFILILLHSCVAYSIFSK